MLMIIPTNAELLLSDIKRLQDSPVSFNIILFQVVEHASSLTNKADKRTLSSKIFFIRFKVICKMVDAVSEQRDLAFD